MVLFYLMQQHQKVKNLGPELSALQALHNEQDKINKKDRKNRFFLVAYR
mgnify:CR=1 FL=1